ncbi:MAG: DUF4406 domain-containing protein [Candidatus Jordarchaeaceae archaeon]
MNEPVVIRKRVYVAGAITPTNPKKHPAIEYLENVSRFMAYGAYLYSIGFAPYVPALDILLILHAPNIIQARDCYAVSMAFLDACDAVLVLPHSENSIGTKNELEYAKKKGIPIFYSIEDLSEHFFGEDKNA